MMKVAFQMDKLQQIKFTTDTSIMLINEAFKRKYDVFIYQPNSLTLDNNLVFANMIQVTDILDLSTPMPIIHNAVQRIALTEMDIIFLRQDPPFDMAYITSTFLLEKIMDKVKVVNNPISVRNSPEKLLVTNFIDLMPKTIISRDKLRILEFLEAQQQCVIKPLYGNAGADVFFLEKTDFNVEPIIDYFCHNFKEQFVIQEFLPNIVKGDKRLILIDGQYVGGFNRIPQVNDIRSNMAVGGKVVAFEKLTLREEEICRTISKTLKDLGLFLVGIDVIDGYLTEINVTSPTGLNPIMKFNQLNLASVVFDTLLK